MVGGVSFLILYLDQSEFVVPTTTTARTKEQAPESSLLSSLDDDDGTTTTVNGVIYVVPQISKSGSSTLRDLFGTRNQYYGNPAIYDPRITTELERNGCNNTSIVETFKGWNRTSLIYTRPNGTKEMKPPPPHYPLIQNPRKYTHDPSFWRLSGTSKNDIDCVNAALKTAFKFWKPTDDETTSPIPTSIEQGPKLIVQTSLSHCLQTTIPTTNSGANDDNNATGSLACRALVQIRHPISWMKSHYKYFCVDCRDNKKFCGALLDAKCGKKHKISGDHETIVSWAQKYGNVFTRLLHPDPKLLEGGTTSGTLKVEGWTYPLEIPRHVNEALERVKGDQDCIVALEDPLRLEKIENCLGDRHGLFKTLGFSSEYTANQNSEKQKNGTIISDVDQQLEELLAADIALYQALFPNPF